ncbi:hypothetical protein PR048_032983 [Dryococelus australis]|uniref:Uncharacterized protein n=1 Tax=Dryococelus australis TaxID=614101 RepID=A0ABQ9G3U1_9NEOP|nr:hypothetical protein PR048_032983 [Dryococelus australis]
MAKQYYFVLAGKIIETSFAIGNCAGRCLWLAGFLGDFPSPLPSNSGAVSYSPHFTLIGSQDHDIESRPYLFTCTHRKINEPEVSVVDKDNAYRMVGTDAQYTWTHNENTNKHNVWEITVPVLSSKSCPLLMELADAGFLSSSSADDTLSGITSPSGKGDCIGALSSSSAILEPTLEAVLSLSGSGEGDFEGFDRTLPGLLASASKCATVISSSASGLGEGDIDGFDKTLPGLLASTSKCATVISSSASGLGEGDIDGFDRTLPGLLASDSKCATVISSSASGLGEGDIDGFDRTLPGLLTSVSKCATVISSSASGLGEGDIDGFDRTLPGLLTSVSKCATVISSSASGLGEGDIDGFDRTLPGLLSSASKSVTIVSSSAGGLGEGDIDGFERTLSGLLASASKCSIDVSSSAGSFGDGDFDGFDRTLPGLLASASNCAIAISSSAGGFGDGDFDGFDRTLPGLLASASNCAIVVSSSAGVLGVGDFDGFDRTLPGLLTSASKSVPIVSSSAGGLGDGDFETAVDALTSSIAASPLTSRELSLEPGLVADADDVVSLGFCGIRHKATCWSAVHIHLARRLSGRGQFRCVRQLVIHFVDVCPLEVMDRVLPCGVVVGQLARVLYEAGLALQRVQFALDDREEARLGLVRLRDVLRLAFDGPADDGDGGPSLLVSDDARDVRSALLAGGFNAHARAQGRRGSIVAPELRWWKGRARGWPQLRDGRPQARYIGPLLARGRLGTAHALRGRLGIPQLLRDEPTATVDSPQRRWAS